MPDGATTVILLQFGAPAVIVDFDDCPLRHRPANIAGSFHPPSRRAPLVHVVPALHDGNRNDRPATRRSPI
jgi:hypothetical protein